MKEFTLIVTEEDVRIIGAALDELPRKFSNTLVMKLQEQINTQVNTPPAPVEEDIK